jgi:peroxiredoxin Q/BCP
MTGEERTPTGRGGSMARLATGDKAPAFSLPDQDGTSTSLSSYSGRRVVVYFYPADDTPGCTKEACQFNDRLEELSTLGVDVLGISPDDAASHRRFRERYDLDVRLLTDAGHTVMETYGAWGEKTLYGRTSVGVIRSTFLVDGAGTIEHAWYNVRADGHAAKVLDLVRA